MTTNVDLTELAIDRSGTDLRTRRHLVTRYLLPLVLVSGFVSLVAWACRDLVFPPRAVTVVPVFATTATVRQTGTPLFQASGWIEPRPTPIRVAALAPGVVEKLLVVEDQPLKAGDTVAELVKDDAELNFERAQADSQLRAAELDEAQAQFKAAQTRFKQPVHLEAALRQADAELAEIQTTLRNLPFELRRATASQAAARNDYEGKLAATGVVAGVEIDIARSRLESTEALVEELQNRDESLAKEQTALLARRDAVATQLKLLADEMGAAEQASARVKAATARVEQARVAVAQARLQLDRMTITAPIDGRIFHLIAHPGASIGSGMTQMIGHDGSTIVTMYRPEMLQVGVDVRFEDLPQVSLQQPVEITNAALSAPLIGEVLFISSEADIQKNTLQVKVAVTDPSHVFKPEMLVHATFLAPQQSEQKPPPTGDMQVYVLQQLIQSDDNGSFVWIADQSNGVARRTRIETGAIGTNGLVQVTNGLPISARLIVSGADGLQDGDSIRITREDPTLGARAGGGASDRLQAPQPQPKGTDP